MFDDFLDPRVADGHEHPVGQSVVELGQHGAVGALVGVQGHAVDQRVEHVAPAQDLAHPGLDAAEVLRSGDFQGLHQQPGDEVELGGETDHALEGEAVDEAGLREEVVDLLHVPVGEDVLPRD
ncbi:hypothetical protein D9M72_511730 [compost metagenome]